MATGTMATAAGAAIVLYFLLSRRMAAADGKDGRPVDGGGGDRSKSSRPGRRRFSRRPPQAPATWREAVATLLETLRFTYSETLGKWPIGDLAFGIKYLMRKQGNLQVASIYAGSNCIQLEGPELTAELIDYLRLLNLCMLFSKRPFPVFLESAGYVQEDVLLQEPKARLLKPAFTILCDKSSKHFVLLIRGTHSIKDTLTAASGAVVPFHHSVLHEGGISNLVLGYAHCGMVAAARWIAKHIKPTLLKAMQKYPGYEIKIVGHSLGGGTAALLTYILREHEAFSSSTCIAFAPAACMTWDLAESGKDFITSIVNGSDLVPTFSTASIDDLRSEVRASSWLNDLRDQVEHTKFLNVFYRSASALGTHLQFFSNARTRVVHASAFLHPVSSGTQVMMERAQNAAQAVVGSRSSLSSWSCMGPRRRMVGIHTNCDGNQLNSSATSGNNSESLITEHRKIEVESDGVDFHSSTIQDDVDEGEPIQADQEVTVSSEEMSDCELWLELENELHRQGETDILAREEEAAAVKEIMEKENIKVKEVVAENEQSSMDGSEMQRFYPPGKILHIVTLPVSNDNQGNDGSVDDSVSIYETPRDLYAKLRLSRTMINDHYMPAYKKMIELLIYRLGRDTEVCPSVP